MKGIASLISKPTVWAALGFVLGLPEIASANQPPAPGASVTMVLLPPILWALMFAGGGYAIKRAKAELAQRRKTSIWRKPWFSKPNPKRTGILDEFIVLAIFFVLSSIGGGPLALLFVFIYSFYALLKGTGMIWMGLGDRLSKLKARIESEIQGGLPLPSPRRLVPAGVVLCLVAAAAILALPNFAVQGSTDFSDRNAENNIKKLTTYQMAMKEQNGKFQPYVGAGKDYYVFDGFRGTGFRASLNSTNRGPHHYLWEISMAEDGQSFKMWAMPTVGFTLPFAYFFSMPSFYADESGDIRSCRVHKAHEKCPPDAPIFYQITKADVLVALHELKAEAQRQKEEAQNELKAPAEPTSEKPSP